MKTYHDWNRRKHPTADSDDKASSISGRKYHGPKARSSADCRVRVILKRKRARNNRHRADTQHRFRVPRTPPLYSFWDEHSRGRTISCGRAMQRERTRRGRRGMTCRDPALSATVARVFTLRDHFSTKNKTGDLFAPFARYPPATGIVLPTSPKRWVAIFYCYFHYDDLNLRGADDPCYTIVQRPHGDPPDLYRSSLWFPSEKQLRAIFSMLIDNRSLTDS